LAPPESFSPCRKKLIKTYQIEALNTLITEMAFNMGLVKWSKIAVKKCQKSCPILKFYKNGKNKKCAPNLIFVNKQRC
jgi:hypothetical protein